MAGHPGPPEKMQPGFVPCGAVLRFYDQDGRIVVERVLSHISGTRWQDPAEASAAVDAGLAGLSLVLYDGDTGERLPPTFGLACQLRPTVSPAEPTTSPAP
jgi:hypothetical protein